VRCNVPIRAAPPLSRVLTSSGLREYLTCGYTLLGRCCAAQSLDLGLGVDRSESDVSAHALLGFDPLTMPRDTNRGDTGRRVDGRSWRRGRTTPRRPTISRAAASAAPRSVRSAAACVCLFASTIAADTATRAPVVGVPLQMGAGRKWAELAAQLGHPIAPKVLSVFERSARVLKARRPERPHARTAHTPMRTVARAGSCVFVACTPSQWCIGAASACAARQSPHAGWCAAGWRCGNNWRMTHRSRRMRRLARVCTDPCVCVSTCFAPGVLVVACVYANAMGCVASGGRCHALMPRHIGSKPTLARYL
jgi:hypothetical protein